MKLSRDSRWVLASMHRPTSRVLDQPSVPMRTPMGTTRSPCDNFPYTQSSASPAPQCLSLCPAARLHPKLATRVKAQRSFLHTQKVFREHESGKVLSSIWILVRKQKSDHDTSLLKTFSGFPMALGLKIKICNGAPQGPALAILSSLMLSSPLTSSPPGLCPGGF